jgi:hypothetical protein
VISRLWIMLAILTYPYLFLVQRHLDADALDA